MRPAHYRFSPSGFGIMMQGSGCWHLNRQFPETTDPDASEEGTAAHEVASTYRERQWALGELTSNGVAVTRGMLDGAAEYRGYIEEIVGPNVTPRFEQQIRIPCLHLTDCGGTPDADAVNEITEWLEIFDYKFGHGYVEVFENWQLLAYASGLLELPHVKGKVRAIRMHIIQPRCYTSKGITRSWMISVDELIPYRERLRARIAEIEHGEVETSTGGSCRYCNARHACTTLQRSAYKIVDHTMSAMPHEMPPEAVGYELSILDAAEARLKARKAGLEAQAMGMIRSGKIVPGRAIEHSSGREKWKVSVPEVAALGELFGVSLVNAPEAVTPTQARSKLKGLLDEAVIATMTERPRGEPKLVAEDTNAARRAFAHI